MATRTNPRRRKHRKQNSLSAYDSGYDQRHVHYAASPTPGNSASRHHRKNSLKAKQLNMLNIRKMNVKYSNEEMNQINEPKSAPALSTPPKQYKIDLNAPAMPTKAPGMRKRTESQPLSHITAKRNDLKEWELTLKMKENEMNQIKSKNTEFIQSLQKQIESLSKALNTERNKTKQHKLSAEDLSDLDAIKRENSTLRGTIRRMRDEMQIKRNGIGVMHNTQHNIHNNYYINTINYNNIIHLPKEQAHKPSNSRLFSVESLSLREMESEYMKRKHVLDEKESSLNELWSIYNEQKSALDCDRNSLAIGQRELFRNNRRLKMKLQQLQLLKHEEILNKIPPLLAISNYNDNMDSQPPIQIGRFSSIKLESIRNSISHEHNQRKQNVNDLRTKFEAFKERIDGMEHKMKEWMEKRQVTHSKYSERMCEIIDRYLEKSKKENGLMRRFDTKQFDPIDLSKHLRMKTAESTESKEANDEAEERQKQMINGNTKATKHQTQFSFERNMSFDISDLENELEHKEEEEIVPVFNRKRTMSIATTDKTNDDNNNNKGAMTTSTNDLSDIDLLRIIRMIECENDRLREEVSAYKTDNFSLRTSCFCLSYDKQLLLEQIEELNEVNAELAHKMKEMTECQRDSGILRQELLNKDVEIASKHDTLRDIHQRYDKLKIEYAAQCEAMEKLKTESDARSVYWNEYVSNEGRSMKRIEHIYNEIISNPDDRANIKSIVNKIQNINDNHHNNSHKSMDEYIANKQQPPIIIIQDIATKLLTKIGVLLLTTNTNQSQSRDTIENELSAQLLARKESEIASLKREKESLASSLMRCEVEREDIYSLFSFYKKRAKELKCEMNTLKTIEIEHRQMTQQLSQTQTQLETEQKNYRKFKLTTQRKLSAMSEIEAQHRKLSSASFAKQRLDSLLGQSEDILNKFTTRMLSEEDEDEISTHSIVSEEEEDAEEDGLYYGGDTEFNADTMLITDERRNSSMVINDDVVQDSKIHDTHLSKDIDLEIYGFDVDVLSPLQTNKDGGGTDKPFVVPRFEFGRTPKKTTHVPQDSFMAMAPHIKQQILVKKHDREAAVITSKKKTAWHDAQDNNNNNTSSARSTSTGSGRRNTVDRYIENRDEMETKKPITIISQQETQILAPGKSPLAVINNKKEMNLKKKFDVTYRKILEGNAQRFNNDNEADGMDADTEDEENGDEDEDMRMDDDDDEDYNDIYGEYGGVKQLEMENTGSDGYLELSDTMKISREQFQELRNQHHNKLLHNQLSEIHELELEMHKKNESVDVKDMTHAHHTHDIDGNEDEMSTTTTTATTQERMKKHKRNATTVVHPGAEDPAVMVSVSNIPSDVPQLDHNNRVRGSYNNIDSNSEKDNMINGNGISMDEHGGGPGAKKVHKTTNSVVSEHGTHYISYENDTPIPTPQHTD